MIRTNWCWSLRRDWCKRQWWGWTWRLVFQPLFSVMCYTYGDYLYVFKTSYHSEDGSCYVGLYHINILFIFYFSIPSAFQLIFMVRNVLKMFTFTRFILKCYLGCSYFLFQGSKSCFDFSIWGSEVACKVAWFFWNLSLEA